MISNFFKRFFINKNKKKAITICDSNYYENCKRLVVSLHKTNPDILLTIYHNSNEKFSELRKYSNVRLKYLDQINKITVKRAKFFAYYDAIKEGDFLYLDSDVIVLDDISELFENNKFTG
jgi:lipopolysaccharide biosynthesis glycosyltransferase